MRKTFPRRVTLRAALFGATAAGFLALLTPTASSAPTDTPAALCARHVPVKALRADCANAVAQHGSKRLHDCGALYQNNRIALRACLNSKGTGVTPQIRTAAHFCATFPEFRPADLRTECTAIAARDERTIGKTTLPNGYAVVNEMVSEARVEYPKSLTKRRLFLADYLGNI
jgi:hypothetical protein